MFNLPGQPLLFTAHKWVICLRHEFISIWNIECDVGKESKKRYQNRYQDLVEELCHVIVKGIPEKRLLFSIITRETYNCYYCKSSYHQHSQAYQTERISLTCMFDLPVCPSFIFFLISGPVATKHQPEVLQYFDGNDRTDRKPYPIKDYLGIWHIICLSYMKHSKLFLVKKAFLFSITFPLRGKNSLKYCFPNDLRLSPW